MKKLILILTFLYTSLFGQVVNETFSDFTLPTDASTIANHILDGTYQTAPDSIQEDLSANNNDLAADGAGWTSMLDAYSSLGGTSPIYSGGNFLSFNGTDEFLRRDGGLSGTPDTFTIEFWVATDHTTTDRIICYMDLDLRTDGFEVYESTNRIAIYVDDTGGHTLGIFPIPAAAGALDGAWHYIAITYLFNDASGCIGYMDGLPVDTLDNTTISSSLFAGVNEYFIGNGSNEALWYDGDIAQVRLSSTVRTPQEVKEGYHLANGWYSKNGNVFRINLTTWNQGFYDSDTVYYPVADGSNSLGNWELSVDAKGGAAGDVLTTWIGSGAAITQTLTTSSTTYTLDLGAVTLSGDSLWFSASANDTVYIDNVTVTDVSVGYENRFPRFPDFPKFSASVLISASA